MQPTRLQAGQVLADRYRIVRRIGVGGMSTVYLADDLKMAGKLWAVKESLRHSRRPDLFMQEASILAGLSHPFLPKITDFFEPDADGFSYIVMEFIHGESLQARFERLGRMEWRAAVRYAVELCELFDYLHRLQPAPIIYRDLKPANVMLDESDHIRLIDFGIARRPSNANEADTMQLGTAGFAAPEQFRRARTDERTDLYTLGAMLYYLLSGGRYANDGKESLAKYAPQLPERLVRLIDKLLSHEPSDRFASAAEVKDALVSLLAAQAVEVHPSPYQSAGTRKIVLIGSAFAGAGSTFTAMALSRALHRCGTTSAVVECGCNTPELYSLLYGDQKAPHGFVDWLEIGERMNRTSWTDGLTEWLALHPSRQPIDACWTVETAFRTVFGLSTQVVLLDVSAHWRDPAVQALADVADDIIAVVSPDAARLASPGTVDNWEAISALRRAGRPLRLLVNRDAPFKGRSDFIRSLPLEADGFLPELPYIVMREAQWKGEPPMERESSHELLLPAMTAFMRKLLPQCDGPGLNPRKRKFW